MKRFYVEDNADNMVIYTDGTQAIVVAEGLADIEEAKEMDYSGINDCETVEEVAYEISKEDKIFGFDEDDFEMVEDF